MRDPGELYGLPLDQFVPQRAALVKALRADRQRDEAARVAKLGKPTAGAWVVNQLVRTQRDAIARLFDAGDALRRAQDDVVAGRGSAAQLRQSAAAKRETLDALVALAHGLLDAHGHGPSEATLARVSATLDAAALQDGARERVRDGCLTRELEHVGLGDGLGFSLEATGTGPAKATAPRRARAKPDPDQRAQAGRKEDEREARAREAQAREARAAARRAAREADKQARRELAAAKARRDRAAARAEDARERAARASESLHEAQRALQDAEGELDQARRAADAAAAAAAAAG